MASPLAPLSKLEHARKKLEALEGILYREITGKAPYGVDFSVLTISSTCMTSSMTFDSKLKEEKTKKTKDRLTYYNVRLLYMFGQDKLSFWRILPLQQRYVLEVNMRIV